jgi:hypothetical protein
MSDSELKIESGPSAHTQPDWDERVVVEQIWNDLQGTVERSTIHQKLTQVIPGFLNAETYIPIFLRRVTIERPRAGVAGAVPADTVKPTEASPTLVPDTTGATTASSR